jgi:hypothetical protein
MTANEMHHLLDIEKRCRMEQIEGILRRLNPEMTDAQVEELATQFWQRSGFADS